MALTFSISRLLRFALVGGAATLLYGVISVVLLEVSGASTMIVHLCSYALVVPLSFLGQNRITFQFKGAQGSAFVRFVLTSVIALSLSTFAVWWVRQSGQPAYLGVIATMLIVPLISYTIMSLWVFVDPEAQAGKS